MAHVEELLSRAGLLGENESLYDASNLALMHTLNACLRAHHLFNRDVEYIVNDGEVVIVDEFTGRTMPGRRWSDGLHQAIEAKEGVPIQRENQTLASITFQNYFRLYDKLAGMTGTADTEAYEFQTIYGLEVVVIPTHRPMVRKDHGDLVYLSKGEKYDAIIEDIKERTAEGQPVLVGTTSIETSELISRALKKAKIKHEVLNAKQHEREASVVAQAGSIGAVTVATNMAGRGTDILLGGNPDGLVEEILKKQHIPLEEATPEQQQAALAEARRITAEEQQKVIDMGGLHIIGTERHESRRIDNQLRGRAGRQGDPGSSRFFLSLEDELMRRFGRMETIKKVMAGLGGNDMDVPIESRLLDRAIEGAQSRVEGYNFDIRKHTVEFDDVMNTQRRIIYTDRQAILEEQDMHERVLEMVGEEIASQVDIHLPPEDKELWDMDALLRAMRSMNPLLPEDMTTESLEDLDRDEIEEKLIELVESAYDEREQAIGSENMRYVERRLMLGAIDRQWVEYLTAMDELRQSINLQAYAQRDPLVEFKRRSFDMFDELKNNITHDIVYQILPTTFQYEAHLQRIREEQEQRLAAAQRGGVAAEQGRASRTVRKAVQMPGRNDPCPCGSGKKFKQCHLGREEEIVHLLRGSGATAPTVSAQLATGGASLSHGGNRQEAAAVAAPSQAQSVPAEAQAPAESGDGSQSPAEKPTPRGRAAPAVPAASGGNGKKKKGKTARGKQQPARKK
jgi:preprotein translocase subunit SecA